jgi:hypothetical protein
MRFAKSTKNARNDIPPTDPLIFGASLFVASMTVLEEQFAEAVGQDLDNLALKKPVS